MGREKRWAVKRKGVTARRLREKKKPHQKKKKPDDQGSRRLVGFPRHSTDGDQRKERSSEARRVEKEKVGVEFPSRNPSKAL